MKITKKELFKFCDDNNDAINELQSQSENTDFLLAVLIQQLKDSGVIDEVSPEPKPQLKQLDQSVFKGIDEKWRFAAIDKNGLLKAFTYEPKLSVSMTGFILLIGNTIDIGENYDASNWRNSLIERGTTKELTGDDLSSELTGSELCKAMLARGDKWVVCRLADTSDEYALNNGRSILVTKFDGDFYHKEADQYWRCAVPINNQGEPLTAAEVGL